MSAIRHRGQPLASLGLLLGGWILLRAAVWEPPFVSPELADLPRFAESVRLQDRRSAAGEEASGAQVDARSSPAWTSAPSAPLAPIAPPILAPAPPPLPLSRAPLEPLQAERFRSPTARATASPASAHHAAAAHQLLYLAALGRVPLPPGLALTAVPSPAIPASSAPAPSWAVASAAPRWSGDGWVLVRRGAGGLAAATGSPAYGASQAGAVLRFALVPSSARAPQAYLRASRALGGFDEGEVAAGLSARPLAALPLRLLGEARVQRGTGATRVRPVVSLVSEVPPLRLPLGVTGEAYAQVGYAGAPLGSKRGATPFFDVQAVADRRLAVAGPVEVRVGGGAWSGGQEGATRLDLGPRASLRLDTAPARSRLALDWRFRVAGNASPASGPTLTFSAGF